MEAREPAGDSTPVYFRRRGFSRPAVFQIRVSEGVIMRLQGHCADGGGIQKHSAGETYPWVCVITENYVNGIGSASYVHPNGKRTPRRFYSCWGGGLGVWRTRATERAMDDIEVGG
jgi:hypothetical protein